MYSRISDIVPKISISDTFIKVQIKSGKLRAKWKSADNTLGDLFAKPMQVNKFIKFRKFFMVHNDKLEFLTTGLFLLSNIHAILFLT